MIYDFISPGRSPEALRLIGEIVQSSPEIAVIGEDARGRIALWNEGARRLYGYDPAEIAGSDAERLHAPEEIASGKTRSSAATALESGRWEGTLLQVRKNGRKFLARTALTPYFDDQSQHAGYLRICWEIEPPNDAALEARFQAFLESAPDAMVVTDAAGRILAVNSQTGKLFGYSREQLNGMPVEQLIPERFRRVHPSHRERYAADPHVRPMGQDLELFGLRSDGSEFPVEISLSPFESEGRRYVVSAVRDGTYRKKVEARFRGLLESAPDAMVIIDNLGRMALVNSQAEKLFGYTRAEMLGKSVEMLVPERMRGSHQMLRGEFFTRPRVRPIGNGMELYAIRKDGTEFPAEIGLSPLETEEGMLVSSSIRDITDRLRFERALQEKNVELENASRAKDRFLASMSHELRTPLNAIIGFTGTLLMKLPGPLLPQQEKHLRTVQSSARHLLSLINDLLDLAKIDSGKVELMLEPVDCAAVLEETASALRPAAEEKALTLQVHIAEPGLMVRADRRAFSQILINLVNNGIKFTESGSVSIRAARQPDSRRVAVQVIDTGPGISEEDQAKLFKPFSQIDSPLRGRGGSGLGLHLSRKLAELLGGEIRLSSRAGEGSTFTLFVEEA